MQTIQVAGAGPGGRTVLVPRGGKPAAAASHRLGVTSERTTYLLASRAPLLPARLTGRLLNSKDMFRRNMLGTLLSGRGAHPARCIVLAEQD